MTLSRLKKMMLTSPTRMIAVSFAVVIGVGALLLTLPISSRAGISTPLLDCLFTATSAACVTGLIIYDTYQHWTVFGQIVILMLIQIGGLGLVTLTTFFNIIIGKKLGLRSMHLAQESVSSFDADIWGMIRTVVKTALIVESIGAALLACTFLPKYGLEGIYISIFLSISAFCNAGFDVLGREGAFMSVSNYNSEPLVLMTISVLIIAGGIGFIVVHDLAQWRVTKKITLHTRVVLSVTAALLLGGMICTALLEWKNPQTLAALPTTGQKLLASWFHSVSTRTAGFNSIDMAALTSPTKVLSCFLMFIGAAPGSTGGGIKCTTLAVIFMTVWCVIRGDEETVLYRRRVDRNAVYKSLAVMILGLFATMITAGCIMVTMHAMHDVSGLDAMFESISAFATVGLSVGISGEAPPLAHMLLIFSMYLGRLGPVSFFLSLAMRSKVHRREILPEGKILIG